MRDDLKRSEIDAGVSSEVRAAAPGWPRWVFRICMTVAAVLLVNQAVYAGQFLAGTYGALHLHRENATYAGIAVAIAAAAGDCCAGRAGDRCGPPWRAPASSG